MFLSKPKFIIALLLLIFSFRSNSQGYTTPIEGHHLVGVKLVPLLSKLPLNYAIENKYSSYTFAGFLEPYYQNNIVMKGMLAEAALAIDWWALFGEPAEQYIFTWIANDYYTLSIPSPTGGGANVKVVSKSSLSKYPDLLMRYEALKPTDVAFEIIWSFAVTDSDIFDQTGFSFLTYYKTQNKFKTVVSPAGILVDPSGKIPLAVPGIRQGKGEEFLGLPKLFPKEKVKELMQLFAKSKRFYIEKVNITKINWPISEMKAIADKYEQYEKGETTHSPTQIINEELRKNQNLTTYNNNDFWADAYEDEFTPFEIQNDFKINKQVIRSGMIVTYSVDPNQYQLSLLSPKSRYIIKQNVKNNTFQIINSKGVVQLIDGHSTFDFISNNSLYVYLKDYRRIRLLAKLSGIMGPDHSLDYDSINKAIDALNGWDDNYTRKEKHNIKAGREVYRLSTYLSSRDSPYGVGSFKKYTIADNLKIVSSNIIYKYFAERDYK
jgi:hypothetical protein